jgi:hypothetical protein
MKLIFCKECGDIFSPGKDKPKRCECGYSVAKWDDPKAGTLRVASRGDAGYLAVIGLHNRWLMTAATLPSDDELHRAHNESECAMADGYLFKTRNCPVIVVPATFGGQITYDPELLKEVEWHGKFDSVLKRALVPDIKVI